VQVDAQLLAKVGGNPLLQPETGDTLTAGLVWTPQFAAGNFSATVDYWQINLDDGISSLGVQFILDDCYINQNDTSCGLITRRADFSVGTVINGSLNVSEQGANGIDTELRYAWDTGVGQFEAAILWAHLLERTKVPFAGAPEEELSGRYTDPTAEDGGAYAADKINKSFKWNWNNLTLGYLGEYIDSLDSVAFFLRDYPQKIDSQLYHDLLASYELDSGTGIAIGITNVTDEEPPYIDLGFNAKTDPSTYRMFGRGYYLRLTQKFK
jgi:outer membrane receptor protein involved in Fe transport